MNENADEFVNVDPVTRTFYLDFHRLGVVAFDYIPSPLLTDVNQSELEFTNHQPINKPIGGVNRSLQLLLERYGNIKELTENLEIYQHFPLKHKRFGVCQNDQSNNLEYNAEPYLFRSTNGSMFYRKLDFLLHVHSKVHSKYMMKGFYMPSQDLIDYMRKVEQQHENCYEFYKYDPKVFEKIMKSLQMIVDSQHDQGQLSPLHHSSLNLHNMFAQILPPPPPPPSNGPKISDLKALQNLYASYPELFLPYSKTVTPTQPPVVRIFKDGDQKFVMESELFNNHIMKNLNARKSDNGLLYSMDLDGVFRKFPELSKQISFILVPISRAKNAAVPIVTPFGGHCILAQDALSEILHRLISALKVFQKFDVNTWNSVTEYMKILEATFPVVTHGKLFLDMKEYDKLKVKTDEYWMKIRKKNTKNNKKKKTPKVCRDVGRFGFTLDFLKEELKYLELTEAFPDIIGLAENAYSQGYSLRKDQFLRTVDLIDEVENCQMICLLNMYPMLKTFFHSQKACHQIGNLQCDLCNPETKANRFKNAEFIEIGDSELRLKMPCFDGIYYPETDWMLDGPGEKSTMSNLKFLAQEEISKNLAKYFIMDSDDVKWAADSKKSPRFLAVNPNTDPNVASKETKVEEFLQSLDNFTKANVKKKVYIRTISIDKEKYVFADDVIEIIPIVLRQQNTPIGSSDNRLEKFRKVWNMETHFHRLLKISEVEKILEGFNVNKSLITVVLDAVQRITVGQISARSGHYYATTFSPNGEKVMNRDHAAFKVFDHLVCGINWSMFCCTKHPGCVDDFKKRIIELMKEFLSVPKTVYISWSHVEEKIKNLQDHCTYKLQKDLKLPEVELPWYHEVKGHTYQTYQKFFISYGLKIRLNSADFVGRFIPLWVFRVEYLTAWSSVFFGDSEEMHRLIRKITVLKIPQEEIVNDQGYIQKTLKLDFSPAPKIEDTVEVKKKCAKDVKENLKVQDSNVIKILEEKAYRSEELEEILKEKEVEIQRLKAFDKKQIVEDLNSQIEDLKKLLKEKEDEVKATEKILSETNAEIKLDTLKMESALKESENGRKGIQVRYEKSVEAEKVEKKKSTDLEKKMKEMQKEMEMMKKLNSEDLKKKDTEIQKKCVEAEKVEKKNLLVLERKLKEMEEEMEKIEKMNSENLKKKDLEIEKITNSKLQLENNKKREIGSWKKTASNSIEEVKQLKAKISEKEADEARIKLDNKGLLHKIRNMEVLAEKDQMDMVVKLTQLESGISEKERLISELQESNQQKVSEKEKCTRELQDRILSVRDFINSQFPLATSSESALPKIEEEPKRPSPLRCQLLGLQKIKDTLYLNSPLKLASEMKEKLISLSTQPEIHQMAIYEYQQYEGKLRNYQQEVEKKIQLLKKSESDDVTNLPSLPDFPSFSDRFIREYWLEIDKQKVSGELQDSECLYCHDEMKSEEKTLKCEHCRKITHLECASKWLQIHRSCPHCRREQLDPNEFPNLQ